MWDGWGDFAMPAEVRRLRQSLRSQWLKRWSCLRGAGGLTCSCLIHLGIQPGNQPRKNWKQSLAFIALGTIHLSFAKPDGMSINARRQPRSAQLPGVFLLGIVLSEW